MIPRPCPLNLADLSGIVPVQIFLAVSAVVLATLRHAALGSFQDFLEDQTS